MYLRSLEINTAYEWDLEYGGGNPVYLENGIKDCSFCDRVHDKEFIKKLLKDKLYNIL